MSLADALADLAAATSNTDHLGRAVVIDGTEVVCVKRSLTMEELQSVADGLGMAVEGLRLTVDPKLLPYPVGFNSWMTVAGKQYRVAGLSSVGDRVRLTLTRNVG